MAVSVFSSSALGSAFSAQVKKRKSQGYHEGKDLGKELVQLSCYSDRETESQLICLLETSPEKKKALVLISLYFEVFWILNGNLGHSI